MGGWCSGQWLKSDRCQQSVQVRGVRRDEGGAEPRSRIAVFGRGSAFSSQICLTAMGNQSIDTAMRVSTETMTRKMGSRAGGGEGAVGERGLARRGLAPGQIAKALTHPKSILTQSQSPSLSIVGQASRQIIPSLVASRNQPCSSCPPPLGSDECTMMPSYSDGQISGLWFELHSIPKQNRHDMP